MITNFVFNDIVLYSKGWYKRGDIVKDLSYLFGKVYGWPPKTESEVASMMLRVIDKLNEAKGVKFSDSCGLRSFYDKAKHYMALYDLSFDMGIISVCMSVLMELSKDEIKLNPPKFGKKEHFRLGVILGEYPISQSYTEMNRIVKEWFK